MTFPGNLNPPAVTRDNIPSTATGGVSIPVPVIQFQLGSVAAPEPTSGSLFGLLTLGSLVYFARRMGAKS